MRAVLSNILIIISLLAILSSCSNGRTPTGSDSQKRIPAEKKEPGKIVFDKEIHNFGSVKDGEIVSYTFVYKNEGGSSFKIVKAEKSCGCIEIKYTENLVLPGESASVEVIFNTAGEWGNVIKSIIVETSDGDRKELQFGAYVDNKQFNNL